MDKQNRFKLRIPRFFRASYASCRSRLLSDATAAQPFFIPQSHNFKHTSAPQPPPPHKFSKCRGSAGVKYTEVNPQSLTLDREFYQNPRSNPRSRKSRSKPRFSSSSRRLWRFEPALNSSSSSEAGEDEENGDAFFWPGSERRSLSRTRWRLEAALGSSSSTEAGEDEESDDVFFSSRSRFSDASAEDGAGCCEGMMKDSVAVMKRSSDPYEDFRTSMVEMIVEKQILGGKELEKLLKSFLALNSRHHHRVILEVFTEIWEALFCDWS